jgi:hypothetical protein
VKLQTVLVILALVAVAVFLIRRARNAAPQDYRKRFDSTLPQQDSSYLYVPLISDGAGNGVSHHAQDIDCSPGHTDGGSGCSDGGSSH